MSNDNLNPALQKEINVLNLLDQLSYELANDKGLADKVADRLERSSSGRNLREIILRRRAELSYYNQEYAEALKPYLDNLDKANPVGFSRHNFNNAAIRTIYLRVYQAWLWLMDHAENKEFYIELRGRYEIKQGTHDVRIQKKERVIAPIKGEVIKEDYEDFAKLQRRLDEFLTSPLENEMAIFEAKNVRLNEDSINQILDSLAGLDGITAKVEPNLVKILRKKIS